MHRAVMSISDVVKQSYILAYREDVTALVAALANEKLNPTVLRASYSDEELLYARSTRVFISHYRAWQLAAHNNSYTLICESDFVPCVCLGSFPVFWPIGDSSTWGYLYQGSPRVLALIGDGDYLRGHCAPLVAYVINAHIAHILCDFFCDEMNRYDPKKYFTFEAHLQWFVMGRGGKAFIPRKHYGEHGGLPNPEHREHGIPRAGRHRADNLAARLYFRPQYAENWIKYIAVRICSHMRGLARLLSNRWILDTNVYYNGPKEKLKMNAIGAMRLLF
jgi:hypothetical protein